MQISEEQLRNLPLSLSSAWSNPNELILCELDKPVARLRSIRWGLISRTRKIVNECHLVYMNGLMHPPTTTFKYFQICIQYRACLLLNLKPTDDTIQPQGKTAFDSELSMFRLANIVFHLAEVTLFQPSPELPALASLNELICLHFTKNETQTSLPIIYRAEAPEEHPDYWKLIYYYAARGITNVVLRLLLIYSNPIASPIFDAIIYTLRYAPSITSTQHDAYEQFQLYKKHLNDVKSIVTEQRNSFQDPNNKNTSEQSPEIFDTLQKIHKLLRILSGDLNELVRHTSNWLILLKAYITYIRPVTAFSELSDLANMIWNRLETESSNSEYSNIAASSMPGELSPNGHNDEPLDTDPHIFCFLENARDYPELLSQSSTVDRLARLFITRNLQPIPGELEKLGNPWISFYLLHMIHFRYADTNALTHVMSHLKSVNFDAAAKDYAYFLQSNRFPIRFIKSVLGQRHSEIFSGLYLYNARTPNTRKYHLKSLTFAKSQDLPNSTQNIIIQQMLVGSRSLLTHWLCDKGNLSELIHILLRFHSIDHPIPPGITCSLSPFLRESKMLHTLSEARHALERNRSDLALEEYLMIFTERLASESHWKYLIRDIKILCQCIPEEEINVSSQLAGYLMTFAQSDEHSEFLINLMARASLRGI